MLCIPNLLVLLFVFVVMHCSHAERRRQVKMKTHSSSPLPPLPPTALPQNSIKLPLMRPSAFYTCGAASLQSYLYYW